MTDPHPRPTTHPMTHHPANHPQTHHHPTNHPQTPQALHTAVPHPISTRGTPLPPTPTPGQTPGQRRGTKATALHQKGPTGLTATPRQTPGSTPAPPHDLVVLQRSATSYPLGSMVLRSRRLMNRGPALGYLLCSRTRARPASTGTTHHRATGTGASQPSTRRAGRIRPPSLAARPPLSAARQSSLAARPPSSAARQSSNSKSAASAASTTARSRFGSVTTGSIKARRSSRSARSPKAQNIPASLS